MPIEAFCSLLIETIASLLKPVTLPLTHKQRICALTKCVLQKQFKESLLVFSFKSVGTKTPMISLARPPKKEFRKFSGVKEHYPALIKESKDNMK